MGQGESGHYRFFRDLFTGTPFGGPQIWTEGVARKGLVWQTAFPNRADAIADESARRLAWLSNLHYWAILCLLDLSYRDVDHRLRYTGIDHMTTSLWRLGKHLVERYNVGLPFDPMATRYALGRNSEMGRDILTCLVAEAEAYAHELDADALLPQDYDRMQFTLTRMSIDAVYAAKSRDV
jgi:hypothetical protein